MARRSSDLHGKALTVLNSITPDEDQLNCQRLGKLMKMLRDKDTVWGLLQRYSKAEIMQASMAAIYAPKEVKHHASSRAE